MASGGRPLVSRPGGTARSGLAFTAPARLRHDDYRGSRVRCHWFLGQAHAYSSFRACPAGRPSDAGDRNSVPHESEHSAWVSIVFSPALRVGGQPAQTDARRLSGKPSSNRMPGALEVRSILEEMEVPVRR